MMVTLRLLVFFIVFCFIMQTSGRVCSAPALQQKLCPPRCLCEEKEVQFVYVTCYYKKIWIFPATFPDNVETLEFSGNPIGALSASDLKHNALKSLKDLSLENCELTELNDDVFSDLSNLIQLNLANNNLTYVSPDLFVGLFKFRYLNLTGNPLLNINKMKKEFEKKLPQVHIEFRVDKPAPILNHTTAIMPSPGSNNPSTTSSSSNNSGPPQGGSTSSASGGVDAPVDKDAHANTEMSNGSDNHADPTLNSGINESSTTSSAEEGTVATREPFLPLEVDSGYDIGIIAIAVIIGILFFVVISYCFLHVIGQLRGAQRLIRNDRHSDSQADILYAPPMKENPQGEGWSRGKRPSRSTELVSELRSTVCIEDET